MKDILQIKVFLKEMMEVDGISGGVRMIAFTGEADGPYFKGKILPYGVDTQKAIKGAPMQLSARYMLEGTDYTGKNCRLFIENNGVENGTVTKPKICTDSIALAWLEKAVLVGSIEGCGENQIMIHIGQANLLQDGCSAYQMQVCGIPVRNDRVIANLYLPEGQGPFPAIILSHGYNGKGRDFQKEATFFAEHGLVVCTFDFCGGSVHSDSSGDTKKMSVLTEKEDLKAVISFIKARREVAKDQLFLLGASQGGLVTTLAAKELSEDIRGLILYYPAFCIPDDWRKEYPDPTLIPESRDVWGMNLGSCYFKAAVSLDAYEVLEKLEQNILLLHGEKDLVVPLSYAKKAAEIGKNVILRVLPEEGHGFSMEAAEKAMKCTLAFIQEQIK